MLENIINKTKSAVSGLKEPAVNAMASMIYATPPAILWEIYYIGLTTEQSLKARAVGALFHLVKGHPFQWGREKWSTLCRTTPESSKLRKYVVDTTYAVAVHGLAYYCILNVVGTGSEKAAEGALKMAPLGICLSVFNGKWNDWFRGKFGYEPTLHK
ncbi:MAG: L-alanine exporter AlaE [Nanoarchaeota archaeon]|nr:L-alanine exporter AlaE [Nanoarchaeota archaeon]